MQQLVRLVVTLSTPGRSRGPRPRRPRLPCFSNPAGRKPSRVRSVAFTICCHAASCSGSAPPSCARRGSAHSTLLSVVCPKSGSVSSTRAMVPRSHASPGRSPSIASACIRFARLPYVASYDSAEQRARKASVQPGTSLGWQPSSGSIWRGDP
ncbi:hypothetical protein TSOC_004451 [Tetrabaena socialis]|uniref:Uncharacterized protein n=1 Tax=Tetrabaena socialis TaxID=47790 RepID=A0A2J8A8S0_9CHLO|nr:hypothetical protein TSOC_004451 [Tetrabaena socialis]|eukprot:PNH08936.1 hypothetical protein TSOC_004451 [Tetrabaena socialis]